MQNSFKLPDLQRLPRSTPGKYKTCRTAPSSTGARLYTRKEPRGI